MADAAPLRLRLEDWEQVETLLERQIRRGAVVLRAEIPPPHGSVMTLVLDLPSGESITLTGTVDAHLSVDALGRTGVRVALRALEPEALFAMEGGIAHARRRTGPARFGTASSTMSGLKGGKRSELSIEPPPPADEDPAFDPLPTNVGAAPKADDLVNGLTAELEALRAQDPFAALGLRIDPTDAEVAEAFAKRSRRYHPVQLARYDSEQARVLAGEIYLMLRDAFRQLAHAAARETTHALLGTRGPTARRGEAASDPTSASTVIPVAASRTAPPAVPPPMPAAAAPALPATAASTRHTPSAGVRAMPVAPPQRTPAFGMRPHATPPPGSLESPLSANTEERAMAMQPDRVLSFRTTGSITIPPPPADALAPPPAPPSAPPPLRRGDTVEDTQLTGPPSPDEVPSGDGAPDEVTYEIDTPLGDLGSSHADTAEDELARERLIAALAEADAGHWDEAEMMIEALSQAFPRSRDVRAGRDAIVGHRRLDAGERGLALRHFEAAIAVAPGMGLARRGLEAARRAAPGSRAVLARVKPRNRP